MDVETVKIFQDCLYEIKNLQQKIAAGEKEGWEGSKRRLTLKDRINAALARHTEQTQRESLVTSPLKEGVEVPVGAAPEQANKSCPACDDNRSDDERFNYGKYKHTCGEDEPEQASASADWIPYDGSGMPVTRDVVIDAKLRDGQIIVDKLADEFAWAHMPHYSDIIAYRIAKPVTQASADEGAPETDSIMKCLRAMLNERGERREALKGGIECGIENLERDRNRIQRELTATKWALESANAHNPLADELTALRKTLSDAGENLPPLSCIYDDRPVAFKGVVPASVYVDLHLKATAILSAAQERIAILSKELEAMRFIAAEPHAIGKVHAEFGPLSMWTKKGLEDHDREKDERIASLEAELSRIKVAFRVNMLRYFPALSHHDVDKVINASRNMEQKS